MVVLTPFPEHNLLLFGFILETTTRHFLEFLWQKQNLSLASDTEGLALLAITWGFISVILTLVFSFSKNLETRILRLKPLFFSFIAYILSLEMLIYGFNKLFKFQFYQPEANILYTPFGYLDKDILYWSVIGTSYSYNVFLGAIEVFAGVLLLFRRTRLLGSLFCFGILVQILMINISFDITVKGLSGFLLLLSAILIAPFAKKLWCFFIEKKTVQLDIIEKNPFQKLPFWLYLTLKYTAIAFIFIEALIPYIVAQTYNGDGFPRSPYSKAYQVTQFYSTKQNLNWRRVFFHRAPYFIAQNSEDDTMQDFGCQLDTLKKAMVLYDSKYDKIVGKMSFDYTPNFQKITIKGNLQGDSLSLTAFSLK